MVFRSKSFTFPIRYGIISSILFFLLLFFISTGEGATLTVNRDGGADFKTIQNAIFEAESGDTIEVYSGTYNENVMVYEELTIRGVGPWNTIIDGGGYRSTLNITADNCTIETITCTASGTEYGDAGIVINGDNTIINDCLVTENPDVGILVNWAENCTITNSVVEDQTEFRASGIEVLRSKYTTITSNFISRNGGNNNRGYGIYLKHSSFANLSRNTINLHDFGISLYNTSNSIISDNKLLNNDLAVDVNICSNLHLAENSLRYNEGGTEIRKSKNVTIRNTQSVENEYGFSFLQSDSIILAGTTGSFETFGVELSYTTHTTLTNNSFEGGGVSIIGDEINQWTTHSVGSDNLVNGTSILFLANESDHDIIGEYSQVILANCSSMQLRGLFFTSGHSGIQLGFCSAITLMNITCQNMKQGIYMSNSTKLILLNSTIEYCESGIYGLSLTQSTIMDVNIFECEDTLTLLYASDVSLIGSSLLGKELDFVYSDSIFLRDNTFIIEDFSISQTSFIEVHESHFIGNRIILSYSDHCKFRNNLMSNSSMHFSYTTNITISGNHRSGSDSFRIRVYKGESVTITSNHIGFNSISEVKEEGIEVERVTDVTISNNTVTQARRLGISVRANGIVVISDNTCTNNDNHGIKLESFYDSLHPVSTFLVENNTCYNNSQTGIYLDISNHSGQVVNNTCISNANGISVIDCTSNVLVSQNSCLNSTQTGISVLDSRFIHLFENVVNWSGRHGIYIRNSDNVLLNQSFFENNINAGIYCNNVDQILISNCTVTKNEDGIFIERNTDNITITNCTISGNLDFGMFAVAQGGQPVNASGNYWGSDSGPYHAYNNPDGEGDEVNEQVYFKPWLRITSDQKIQKGEDGDGGDLDDLDDDPVILLLLLSLLIILLLPLGLIGIAVLRPNRGIISGDGSLRESIIFLPFSLTPLHNSMVPSTDGFPNI